MVDNVRVLWPPWRIIFGFALILAGLAFVHAAGQVELGVPKDAEGTTYEMSTFDSPNVKFSLMLSGMLSLVGGLVFVLLGALSVRGALDVPDAVPASAAPPKGQVPVWPSAGGPETSRFFIQSPSGGRPGIVIHVEYPKDEARSGRRQ